MTRPRRLAVAGIIALVGCGAGEPSDDIVGAVAEIYYLNDPTPMIDVLVVVDTSPAMAAHRDALVASYQRFTEAFEGFDGHIAVPYLHLGVVTADLGGPGCGPGDGAAFRQSGAVAGDFVDDFPVTSSTRSRNYAGDLSDAITALADAGTDGCTTSQPIAAMIDALDTDNGFRRPEADLMVLFVSASDDTSSISIDAAADYLLSLAPFGDPRRVVVSVIGGPEPAACATPATRLRALAGRFADRDRFTSICDADHQSAFELIHQLFRSFITPSCAPPVEVIDIDPVSPGLQLECSISDIYPAAAGEPVEQLLDACNADATNRPCWRIFVDPEYCAGYTRIEIHRPFGPVRGSETLGECWAQATAL